MLDQTDNNIVVFTSTTISLLTIEHYADTLLWLQAQNYKKINSIAHSVSASHPVYNPKYLNIAILDPHQQFRIFNRLRSKVKDRPQLLEKIEFYNRYYNLMNISNPDEYRKQFAERFNRFAQNQNQDWEYIFPLAHSVAETWKMLYV